MLLIKKTSMPLIAAKSNTEPNSKTGPLNWSTETKTVCSLFKRSPKGLYDVENIIQDVLHQVIRERDNACNCTQSRNLLPLQSDTPLEVFAVTSSKHFVMKIELSWVTESHAECFRGTLVTSNRNACTAHCKSVL